MGLWPNTRAGEQRRCLVGGSRTGAPIIIALVRRICRIVRKYGASDLAAKTTPEFKTAVDALVAACMAFEALDDQPAQVDNTGPRGPEDL